MSAPAKHLKVVRISDPGGDSSWINVVFDDGSFWEMISNDIWRCVWQPDGTSDAFKIRCLEAANEELRQQLAKVMLERNVISKLHEQLSKQLEKDENGVPAYKRELEYLRCLVKDLSEQLGEKFFAKPCATGERGDVITEFDTYGNPQQVFRPNPDGRFIEVKN